MKSWHEIIFRITALFVGNPPVTDWIPSQRSLLLYQLLCFRWFYHQNNVETNEFVVIWYSKTLMLRHCNDSKNNKYSTFWISANLPMLSSTFFLWSTICLCHLLGKILLWEITALFLTNITDIRKPLHNNSPHKRYTMFESGSANAIFHGKLLFKCTWTPNVPRAGPIWIYPQRLFWVNEKTDKWAMRPLVIWPCRLTYWGRDKMAAISRRHFQMHFLEWKYMNFD